MMNLRVLFVSGLIITVFGLFATSTQAQTAPTPIPGWGYINQDALRAGPPGLSIRPINNPGDIPLVRLDIQNFLDRLQAYLDSIFIRNT